MKNNQIQFNENKFNIKYLKDRVHLIRMIKSMNNKLKFREQTYFLAAHYLDIVFHSGKITDTKYELIAVCCLMIAGIIIY